MFWGNGASGWREALFGKTCAVPTLSTMCIPPPMEISGGAYSLCRTGQASTSDAAMEPCW